MYKKTLHAALRGAFDARKKSPSKETKPAGQAVPSERPQLNAEPVAPSLLVSKTSSL